MTFQISKLVGNVTNDPEVRKVGAKETSLKELRVAVNHQRKNKDTGEYEKTGDTTWFTIKLWGAAAEGDFVKGDLIEYSGSAVEKHYEKKDGTEGRGLESDYVESVEIKFPSKNRSEQPDAGFIPAPASAEEVW